MNMIEQMFPDNLKIFYHLIFFPINWPLWCLEGPLAISVLKITLLMLPILLLCFALPTTVLAIATILFRSQRTQFVATLLINWWDGGKSIFFYWSGVLRFLFLSVGWIYGAFQLIIMGLFQTLKDIVFSPLTIIVGMMKGYSRPGIPWIAVLITIFWILLESVLFSFVLTPTMMEIIEGLTNTEVGAGPVSLGLFVFLFMVIGGSFASMHGLVEAFEKRAVGSMIKMLIVEFFVMFIEVMFFYREFVSSLAPWLAQMSDESIKLELWHIILISMMSWVGIRAATWFFFAKYGTPTLLMIISREGMNGNKQGSGEDLKIGRPLLWIKEIVAKLRGEIDWFSAKGQEITEGFVLPPVQILAVLTNFFMIILTGKNLFNLPLKSLSDLKDTKQMIEEVTAKEK